MPPPPAKTRTQADVVSEVARAIEGRLDDIAAEMLARYQERIESYRAASAEILDDAREWARASARIAIGVITGELDFADFVDPLTDVGRRRAAQGFPLDDVLQANLIATEVLWENVSELSPDDDRESALIASVFVKGSVRLLQHAVSALSTGYEEVAHGRVADEEYDMQALMETLAGLKDPDKRHEERARARGVELDALRWCLVARSSHEDAGDAVRDMRRSIAGAAIGRIGSTIVAYLPGEEVPKPSVVPAGIARARDPVRGFKRARATLQVALHLKRDSVCYEDVVPLAMILGGPPEERQAFVEAQLGPLLADPLADELIKTLTAYYGGGQSIAAAARDLYVHRHTLDYRLQRAEQILGRSLKNTDDRILLELALALHSADEG